MKKYLISYWIEHRDQPLDQEEIVEALSPESALKQFLHNHKNEIIKKDIKIKQITT